MNNLYIYAYPGQMLTFQMVTDNNEILTNENCDFADVVRTTSRYLREENINRIIVVGGTVFADKIASMINKNLNPPILERC